MLEINNILFFIVTVLVCVQLIPFTVIVKTSNKIKLIYLFVFNLAICAFQQTYLTFATCLHHNKTR